MNPHPHTNPAATAWAEVLAALAGAGAADAANAAAWWQQDHLGGRATGQTRPTAQAVLTGLADLDPVVLDALPTPGQVCISTVYHQHTGVEAPTWEQLHPDLRRQAEDAYRDSFDRTMHHQIHHYCHQALNPES